MSTPEFRPRAKQMPGQQLPYPACRVICNPRRTFETNIFGYIFMAQAALPPLREGDAIVDTGRLVEVTGGKLSSS